MAITINPTQAASILDVPVNHCYVTSYTMSRDLSEDAPWRCEIRFVMAVQDPNTGRYFPIAGERKVIVTDIENLATLEATRGNMDLALSMGPFQQGLAHVIRSQCQDLNTARFTEG